MRGALVLARNSMPRWCFLLATRRRLERNASGKSMKPSDMIQVAESSGRSSGERIANRYASRTISWRNTLLIYWWTCARACANNITGWKQSWRVQKQELIIANRCSFSRVKICISSYGWMMLETPRKIRGLASASRIRTWNQETFAWLRWLFWQILRMVITICESILCDPNIPREFNET